MAEEFLSQDEVDALLTGTEEDIGIEPAELPPETPPELLSSSLERDKLLTAHMPGMEAANERFARLLRQSLSAFVRRPAEISMGTAQIQRYSAFIDALQMPSALTIVRINPLRGNGLLVCEPGLITAMIETLFGGAGKLDSGHDDREFSATEMSVMHALLTRINDSFRLAWEESYPLSLEIVRSETKPRFATIAAPEDTVISLRCLIDINGMSGAFHMCLPYASLDPIRSTLYSDISKDQLDENPVWTERLSEQLEVAEIEMVVPLTKIDLSFGELINLSAGDFIELDLPSMLEVTINDVPFLNCQYGTNQGRYAIRVDRFLTSPEDVLNGVTDD